MRKKLPEPAQAFVDCFKTDREKVIQEIENIFWNSNEDEARQCVNSPTPEIACFIYVAKQWLLHPNEARELFKSLNFAEQALLNRDIKQIIERIKADEK